MLSFVRYWSVMATYILALPTSVPVELKPRAEIAINLLGIAVSFGVCAWLMMSAALST